MTFFEKEDVLLRQMPSGRYQRYSPKFREWMPYPAPDREPRPLGEAEAARWLAALAGVSEADAVALLHAE